VYHHTGALVRIDRGIDGPQDLRGKKMGVPEYQQTAAVWSRGILKDHFGVDASEIEWWMERPPEISHGGATGFVPPPGITLHYIPRETDMGEMVASGALDGALHYIASDNLVDRSTIDLRRHPMVRRLYDPAVEKRRMYSTTGIFPINHCVVIRRSIVEQNPWVPRSLYRAFFEAKQRGRKAQAERLEPYFATGTLSAADRAALDTDLFAYGIKATRPVLETLTRYSFDQGLTDRIIGLDEIFDPSTLEL
jgi:4,5-dihydroxyphthalate decarboxylase